VVSTLNVQQLESSRRGAQMTGVRQRETVPDTVARQAEAWSWWIYRPRRCGGVWRRRSLFLGPDRRALSHYFRLGN